MQTLLRPLTQPLYDAESIVPQRVVVPHRFVGMLFDLACFLFWSLAPVDELGHFLVKLKRRLWKGGIVFFMVSTPAGLYHPWISKKSDFLFVDHACPQCGEPAYTHLH